MAFVKVTKTSAYYSRFQVPLKRRRQGKTDYKARRNLCRQDKTKYNTPKYRLVVRFTNAKVICQIVYATLKGDIIVCAAESTELARYGLPVGLTNYAAAYATGLLCARRCLKKMGLDEACVGKTEADGEEYHIEEDDDVERALMVILDVGLVRTSTGARVFGALKGAVDGGLHIPHSCKRFPGYVKGEDGAADNYDASAHRDRIYGAHVASYMSLMQEEEPEKYEAHFSRYIKAGINADNLEEKIKALHANIRANPDRVKAPKKNIQNIREGHYIKTIGKDGAEVKYLRPRKLTKAERAQRIQTKLAKIAELAAAADE
eukprot:Blabericola_migrator_1__8464@NODE_4410_length_1176_cov_462_562669_g2728_i0_p1_GENE_NODE_4410_length_1176_cov_462_562669_g2728_i0NODE_4410_length_1176_cov_462_562669_g2728_i0_p1_ORF_typecomplete_len318_score66_71Ribosomal_L5e/PF17144_4/1_8e71Ribosomal_L18_c/PF14204_6/3_8e03Ribosomal_L18_c/PF14204_6/2e28Ribosomal_L18p/PF00861_22/0_0009Ribosomal_L18p/PF00861_22/7_5e03Ribosomal_L18p/PF00861_22/3e03_NODE_4410_length_1176_cov_462_562669_g2728_i026979